MEEAEEDFEVDEGDAEGGGIEPLLAEVGEEIREFFGAEVSPGGVIFRMGPGEEFIEALADGELVGSREALLGGEVEDEVIDLVLHFLGSEAAGAILDEMSGGDFVEGRGLVSEAAGGVSEDVSRLEGAGGGWAGEGGREAGDGVELTSFFVICGDAFQEGAGVGVAGAIEKMMRGGGFDDAARIHDVDVVADLGDDAEVVGDEDDGGAELFLAVFDEVEDLFLDGDIERGGGFIGDEEVRAGDEGHGDHDALAHAAGKFVRVGLDALFGLGDADFFEGCDGSVKRFFSFHSLVDFEGFGELSGNFEVGIQAGHGVLEDHGDLLSPDLSQFLFASLK